MNDPTSVDFWVEELTKDTDPELFGITDEDFYYYTTRKRNYSRWQWNCGYNAGLVNLQTKINTYCIPQWTSHETTTFKPIATDTRGYACQFSCSACDCVVSRAYYMRPDQFDYEYCPYCGRPVESEDDAE